MRQSAYYLKVAKNFPKDEQSVNAKLLIRAGFIDKLMAGVFSLLPIGLRVRNKVESIIREEMNSLGAHELLMPALHPKSIWEITNRWETMKSVMYQFRDSKGREFGLGATHEEVIVDILKKTGSFSYQDLPIALYQIQVKFRNEERPKSGLLRGREFTMKDLYSFHADEKSLIEFYEKAKVAYLKVFERTGLKAWITEASGGDFTKDYSHEFQVEAKIGEDEIFVCQLCSFARNKEIADFKNGQKCPQCQAGALEKVTSVEVGNIFKLGTKYSSPNKLYFKDKNGVSRPVVMGCYGIGVERLIGTVVEVSHDDRGIVWPDSIAPFSVHLLQIGKPDKDLKKIADRAYNKLVKSGIEVLYDDRVDYQPGEKLAEADLVGLPWRAVVSAKNIVQDKIEIKRRSEAEPQLVKVEDFIKLLKQKSK